MNFDQHLMLAVEQAVANSLSDTHNMFDQSITAVDKLKQLVVELETEIKPKCSQKQGLSVQSLTTAASKDDDSKTLGAQLVDSGNTRSKYEQAVYQETPKLPPRTSSLSRNSKITTIARLKEVGSACEQVKGEPKLPSQGEDQPTLRDLIRQLVVATLNNNAASQARGADIRGSQSKTEQELSQQAAKSSSEPSEKEIKAAHGQVLSEQFSAPISTKDINSQGHGADLLDSHFNNEQERSQQVPKLSSKLPASVSKEIEAACGQGQGLSEQFSATISAQGINSQARGADLLDSRDSHSNNEQEPSKDIPKLSSEFPASESKEIEAACGQGQGLSEQFSATISAQGINSQARGADLLDSRDSHFNNEQERSQQVPKLSSKPPDGPYFTATDQISPWPPLRRYRPLYGPYARPAYLTPEPPPADSPVVEETPDPRFDRPFKPILIVDREYCLSAPKVPTKVFSPPSPRKPEPLQHISAEELAASIIRKPRKKPPPRIYSLSSDDEDDGW